MLLANGATVGARDDGGLVALHNACSFGHAEVVGLLLVAGADPNARDNWSYTPLHEAATKGHTLDNLRQFEAEYHIPFVSESYRTCIMS